MKKFIESYLGKSEKRFPIPTGINPLLNPIPDIKSVFFDIYGTLLISASGDVDIIKLSEQNVLGALRQAGVRLLSPDNIRSQAMSTLLRTVLIETITSLHNEENEKGIPYPEVNIIEVWKKVFLSEKFKGVIELPGSFNFRSFALVFELMNNPVCPMPGMKSVLSSLCEKNILLGIISNAQFYTPLLLNYFMAGSLSDREEVHLFHKRYQFFSYQYLRAKPDQFLFDKAKDMLLTHKINPGNVLYVGNDMRNDIVPACRVGFKTVLFAGDKRSLRLRDNETDVLGIKPDAVITALPQLLQIINSGRR